MKKKNVIIKIEKLVENVNISNRDGIENIADIKNQVTEALIEAVKDFEKPPIGIVPQYIHKEKRLEELSKAIERYMAVKLPIPITWFDEYNELTTYFQKNGKS